MPDIAIGDDAENVTRKILLSLRGEFHLETHVLHIGGSIGIALHPRDGTDHGTLLRAADTAMYDAKAQGRATYRFFTPALNDATLAVPA